MVGAPLVCLLLLLVSSISWVKDASGAAGAAVDQYSESYFAHPPDSNEAQDDSTAAPNTSTDSKQLPLKQRQQIQSISKQGGSQVLLGAIRQRLRTDRSAGQKPSVNFAVHSINGSEISSSMAAIQNTSSQENQRSAISQVRTLSGLYGSGAAVVCLLLAFFLLRRSRSKSVKI